MGRRLGRLDLALDLVAQRASSSIFPHSPITGPPPPPLPTSTHPGGGVSATCGANAAREILMDLKRPNTVPEDDCYDE